jgi:hypothetical protein
VLATWTTDSFPADWTRYRDQWEYTHAANAVIKLVALSSLVLSLIVETPGGSLQESAAASLRGLSPTQKQWTVRSR